VSQYDTQQTGLLLLCAAQSDLVSFKLTFGGGWRFAPGAWFVPVVIIIAIAYFVLIVRSIAILLGA
jgi:hypothetical protein